MRAAAADSTTNPGAAVPPAVGKTAAARRRGRRAAPASPRELFPHVPGTKDIRQHPVFQGSLSRWAWKLYTHRLTRAGRWFLGLTLVMGLTLAPGLDVQFYVPVIYILGVWAVAEAATLLNKPRVRLRARHADRVRAGETLPVEVEVTHVGKAWPGLDLNVLPARLPLAVDAVPPDGVPIGTLLPGESKRVRLGLACPKRGAYRLWGYRVETDYPFGLLNAYGQFPQESALLVYPDFTPLERMDLPTGRRHQPGGVLLASHLGDSFEYLGNREYRDGDNPRDIDWRATARLGGQPMALREWREEFFLRVGVVLDTYLPRNERAADRAARAEAFERAVSLSAAVADYLARHEYIVDLFAAGPDLYHLTAGRSLAYLDQILDILACVEGTDAEPLEVIAPQIQDYLARLTTVICVFLEWNETRRVFVDGLRASGAGVKVILLRGGGHDTVGFPPDATVIEPSDWPMEAGQL
jgi:uncharacterized protein (DUF58 family)